LRKDEEWAPKLASSKDTMEGMMAFMEKREPKFIGE
jgi:enoyl-CoA hydratase/carnithine racemase